MICEDRKVNANENLVAKAEIPAIATIIDNEIWLEGERRGCCVSPEDPTVVENVCGIIIRIGGQLREETLRKAS